MNNFISKIYILLSFILIFFHPIVYCLALDSDSEASLSEIKGKRGYIPEERPLEEENSFPLDNRPMHYDQEDQRWIQGDPLSIHHRMEPSPIFQDKDSLVYNSKKKEKIDLKEEQSGYVCGIVAGVSGVIATGSLIAGFPIIITGGSGVIAIAAVANSLFKLNLF